MDGRVLFVGHDADPSGAPTVLLHLLRWLRANTRIEMRVLLLARGALVDDFSDVAETWLATPPESFPPAWIAKRFGPVGRGILSRRLLRKRCTSIRRWKPSLVYLNSVVTAGHVDALAALGAPLLVHAHELDNVLDDAAYVGRARMAALVASQAQFIAVSQAVADGLIARGVAADRVEVVHAFISTAAWSQAEPHAARARLRRELGLADAMPLVGAAGNLQQGKGPDLFVQLAAYLKRDAADRGAHLVWFGGGDSRLLRFLEYDALRLGVAERVHFIGARDDLAAILAGIDAFALTSREDAFPLVMLEAAAAGVPVVCFKGSGGAAEFVDETCGAVVDYLDVPAMASKVASILDSRELRERLGRNAQRNVRERHDVSVAAPQIVEIIGRCLTPSNR